MADVLKILLLYFITRFVSLTNYPVFNDEAIYIRYARVMTTVPNQLWYSLTDSGKQPLLYWIYGWVMKLVADPLLATRLVTVVLGAATPVACYVLGTLIASRRVGIIAAILVIVCPIFLFFDRLALADSFLAALFAWILVFLVRFNNNPTMRDSMILGILVGISFWIKSTGLIFALVCITIITIRNIRHLLSFATPVFFLFIPLYIRPEYTRTIEMANEYTFSIGELFTSGFIHVPKNVLHLLLIYAGFVSPMLFVKTKQRTLLFSWILSVVIIILISRTVHGRYVVFTAVPFLVLIAQLISKSVLLTILTFIPMIALSCVQFISPPTFFHLYPSWQIFAGESFQYVDGWPSGYGVPEVMQFIQNDRNGAPSVVATRWDSGNPEDAMGMFAMMNPDIAHRYLDKRLPEETRAVFSQAATMPTYFVTRKGQYGGFEKILIPIKTFPKPRGDEQIEVFRVQP